MIGFAKLHMVRMSLKSGFFLLLSLTFATLFPGWNQALAQTTPNFGSNVYIFDPSMSNATIQSTLTSLANESQFSMNRYAVLFMPGTYSVQSEIGYYESVAGLGQTPQTVTINGYLTSNQTDSNGNLTTNFWRSLENLAINSSTTLQWGVSQGAEFRRMLVNGPLELTNTNCGEASGGFIADTVVTGNVNPCSQQQWYTRNSSIGSWSGGVWNMVFSGVQGAPLPNYPSGNRYTVLPTSPVSREKAFLYVDDDNNFNVFVPTGQENSLGSTWQNGNAPGYSVPISTFFIATPSTALADINSALLYGQNLILTPGVYQYSGSINITNPNTVVLGLGFATLVPQTGTEAVTVSDVDGVQISGLIIDAGPVMSPVLFQVGVQGGAGPSHQSNPTSLNDVFFRIGGATTGSAATSLEIDSNNVILDNIWAWRADHGLAPTGWTVNVANNGVVVNADNVTALGLAVEHYEQNQVVWNGNGGETIFYQSELPYDVPSQSAWMNGSANGYSSYSVSNSVTTHSAYGLGGYSFFNQGINVVEDSAITAPNAVGVTVTDAVSVFLSGSGSITHTVDNAGTPVMSGSITSYLPFYQGVPCTSTCPQPATNLNAATISPTQINLTWMPSSTPSVTYSIFRSTNSGFMPSTANQIATGVTLSSYADTSAAPSTTYYYLVEAFSIAGASSASDLATATKAANGGLITTDVVKIDSGYTGATPPTGWVADEYFSGGATGSVTHAITIPSGLVNPAPAAVYQTYRKTSGSCAANGVGYQICYAIPKLTPGAAYIVDLHFAEDFYNTAASRQFNVAINGTQVLTNFDIWAVAGGEYVATVQSFYAVADNTGAITITFSTGAHNSPQINGIEVGLGTLTVPIAPASLSAITASDNQINLSWNASSGTVLQYEVFRSTTAGFVPTPANLITTTAATAYSDTSASPSTIYYYIVEANNSYLTSLPSNQASATTEAAQVTPPAAPAAPTALNATTVSTTQINLLWTGSSTPQVQYQLFRSTTAGFTPTPANLVTTTSATGYSDTGVTGSATYYYVVEGVNSVGTSAPSNQASATITLPQATVTLSNLSQTYAGSPLSAGTTTVPAGLNVSLTYNGSSTAPTSAGSYAVVATVNDPNYAGTATGILVISQATATVTLSNLSQTYSNSGLSAAATTTPARLAVILTYNSSPAAPTSAGSYAVVAAISDTNYTGTATGTLVINQAPATVTLGNLSQTYTASALSATVTTSPSGLAVALTYYGSPTAPTAAGSYAVVATVNDTNYKGATTGTLVIAKAAATVTLSSLSQTYAGSALSAAATTSPTGLAVTLTYSGSPGAPATAGAYAVVATVNDPNYAGTTAGTLMIAQAPTTIGFSASPANPITGQPDALSAAVTGAGQPSGSVIFASGSTALCTAVLNVSGAGSCSYVPSTPGSAVITARYQGDSNHLASSVSLSLLVYDAAVKLQVASTQLTYPGATNVTACVSSVGAATTGSVQIFDGTTLITNQTLQGGGCAYWYISPALNAGSHVLTAVYSGDRNNPSGISLPVTVTVIPVPVTLAASCWNASFAYGANYQCTVNLSSNAGAPLGSIAYSYDGDSTVTIQLSNGNAQFTLSTLNVGTHNVAIGYAQQTNYAGAISKSETFSVTAAPVNVSLTPSIWYTSAKAGVAFQAAVASWSAGPPNANGAVSFYDGTTLLFTVSVNSSGQASYTTRSLSAGTHTITATYTGGVNYGTGSSSIVIALTP